MRLGPGSPAPDFTATAWDGAAVSLVGQRGHPVWLAFFRYASCPLCNLRVHEMITRWDRFASRGLRVLGVFQSSAASIARYVGTQRPPFPLLADPDEALYQRYALESSLAGYVSPRNMPKLARATALGFLPGRMDGTKTRLPADFLIDPQGEIRDAFYGSVIGEHIPFERVEAFLSIGHAGPAIDHG